MSWYNAIWYKSQDIQQYYAIRCGYAVYCKWWSWTYLVWNPPDVSRMKSTRRISYEIHQTYIVWNSPDVHRMKFTRRISYEIHQTYLVWNSPYISRMKFTRRISYEIHQTYSLTNGSFISATTSEYFVYFSPHNDKWRKLNWPK